MIVTPIIRDYLLKKCELIQGGGCEESMDSGFDWRGRVSPVGMYHTARHPDQNPYE